MALVDDEILALAEREHVLGKALERRAEIGLPFQFVKRPLDQRLHLFLVRHPARRRQVLAEHVDVRDQPDRHALRKRTDPQRRAVAAEEREESAATA